MILRFPPKFYIEENLPAEGLAHDEELANAKTRMTISKEEGERIEDDGGIEIEEDEETIREMEKMDARTRQVYDPGTGTFDDRKHRATDLKECSRITLPKPLSTQHEANIEMRRTCNNKIYNEYREEFCNKKGEVKGNLTPEEKEGLRSLQKRIREQELVVLKTDKSSSPRREQMPVAKRTKELLMAKRTKELLAKRTKELLSRGPLRREQLMPRSPRRRSSSRGKAVLPAYM